MVRKDSKMSRGLYNGDSRHGDHKRTGCVRRRKSYRCAIKTEQKKMQLRDMIVTHLDMTIGRSHEDEKELANVKFAPRVVREGHTMLPTRYFGRKSKTIPSRALKRRYMGPPKSSPQQQQEDVSWELTTTKHYFLPERTPDPEPPPHIDVPLWKVKPVTSFYQMEGTENINDPVFGRRHTKFELEERRRKRWDLQRLREQRAGERKKQRQKEEQQPSFFPHPRHVEYIEVTDQLPVVAFGHIVPQFQSCEFTLPWQVTPRRGRPSLS